MSSLFGEPKIDMTRGPVGDGQSPSGVNWDKASQAPVSGNTPAARHASATGAAAAAPRIHGRAQQLLRLFSERDRVTLDQAREHLDIPINCVTGPWQRLDKLGWIEGTATYHTYVTAGGRPVRREYHRITAAGRTAALGLVRQEGGRR